MQISFTSSIAIKSSTSKLSPNARSRLLANSTCPMESHAGMSFGVESRVMVCGSMSNVELKAALTFANNSSMIRFPFLSYWYVLQPRRFLLTSCLILTERHGPLEHEAAAYAERSHLLPLIGHSSAPLRRNIVSPVKAISFCVSFRTDSYHRAILE